MKTEQEWARYLLKQGNAMADLIVCIQIFCLVLVSVMQPPKALCQDRIAKLLRTPVFEQRLTAAFEKKDDGVFRSMLLRLNLSAGGPIPPVKYLTGIDKASLREEALYLLSDNRRLDAIRLRDMCNSTPDDWLKSCFGDPVLSPELLFDSGFIKTDQVDNPELLAVLRVLSTYDELGDDPQQCRQVLGDVDSLWSRIRLVAEDRTLDKTIRIDAITALICLGDVRVDHDSSEKYREIKLLMEPHDFGFLVYLRCLDLRWSRAAGVALPLLPDEEFDYYSLYFFSRSPGTEAEFFLDGIDDAATAGSPSFKIPKELATLRSLINPSDEAATRITNERMVEELGDSGLAVRVLTSFLKYSLEQKQGSELQQCLELATAYLEKYQGQLRQDDVVDIELLILRLKGAIEDAGETESLYRRLIEKTTTSGGQLFVPPDRTSKSVPILIRLAEYPAARDRDIQLLYRYCIELRKSQGRIVAEETYCFWRTLGYLWTVSGRDAELLASVRSDPDVTNAFCHGVALRIARSPDEGLDLVHILSNKGFLNDPNNVYSFVLELEMMRLDP